MFQARGLVCGSSVLVLLMFLCEGRVVAQSTTTTPTAGKMGTQILMLPKGTYTLGAMQAAISVDYDYGIVMCGVDGPKLGMGTIINLAGGNWQGAQVNALANTTYWVRSRLNYSPGVQTTAWVRGMVTTGN